MVVLRQKKAAPARPAKVASRQMQLRPLNPARVVEWNYRLKGYCMQGPVGYTEKVHQVGHGIGSCSEELRYCTLEIHTQNSEDLWMGS